jgi:hypothetical protein
MSEQVGGRAMWVPGSNSTFMGVPDSALAESKTMHSTGEKCQHLAKRTMEVWLCGCGCRCRWMWVWRGVGMGVSVSGGIGRCGWNV